MPDLEAKEVKNRDMHGARCEELIADLGLSFEAAAPGVKRIRRIGDVLYYRRRKSRDRALGGAVRGDPQA
jgi:hypothetical protein